ncbi:MAG: nitroreductase family protein [Bacillota bacterium]|jgi:predicted oxidoreductase (fatty acid repression mutant protein)|nr:nitroreductase family protein [Bacillota bacterium]
MAKDFLTAVAERRSHYAIGNKAVTSDERIIDVLEQAVLHAPSAYNSQSTRVVLLLGKHHERLWTILMDIMRAKLSAEKFPRTEQKIKGFMAGYGTVLFFEDTDVVQGLVEKFPTYADNFRNWSLQGAGIMEYIVWTALEAEGYGASLQHYNELIADAVKKEWNLSDSWRLDAQMPFGNIEEKPADKSFQPVDTRLKIFK